jgi:hypothetical protein
MSTPNLIKIYPTIPDLKLADRRIETSCKDFIIDSMELHPSWEATGRSATQKFSNILWDPIDHYPILSLQDQF